MSAPRRRLLVVNADDLGLSPGVNEGIFEAHLNGIVTSASLMVRRPGAAAAAARADQHPELSVGLHFEDDGAVDLDDPSQVARAFHTQLDRFRELTGHNPTHFDAHHHAHSRDPARLATFGRLVAPLAIPVRHDGRVAYIADFWAQTDDGATVLDRVRPPHLLELVRARAGECLTELACHPARVTGDFSSSYLDERAVELATLTEPGLREQVEATGVRLVSFHAWGAV
jgi:predicted glycoside hydrolase/deacetylase ChbG (UPF0249 family)